MFKYQVVLVKPNKAEVEIAIVDKLTEVPNLLNTIQYVGSWITPMRKLLSYGRGEIIIREIEPQPMLAGNRIITAGSRLIHELLVANHPTIRTICMSNDHWVAYNCLYSEVRGNESILFQARNFTMLADLAGKDLAYGCLQYHEAYLSSTDVKGAG
jgi:hypothetical protein